MTQVDSERASGFFSEPISDLRYIEEDGFLSTADGLAGDEALAHLVAAGIAPPTLRLYHYRPSAIVGRYQHLTDAIDLDFCKENDIEWNRRHTGGGTVLMGPEQVAIGLALPDAKGRFAGSIRRHFEFFAQVVSEALAEHGLQASFAGKNDLQVEGRKIAGLAISQDVDGAVFYHGSLLLGFDVELMVRVLNLPTRNLDDRGQSCFSRRMTTVHEHYSVSFDEMRESLASSLASVLGSPIEKGSWTAVETERFEELKNERYENDEWIYSSRVMRHWNGSAQRKTSGGNLRVYVSRSNSVLDAVLITGDYFTRSITLAELEASLKSTPARHKDILDVLNAFPAEPIYLTSNEELSEIILLASSK